MLLRPHSYVALSYKIGAYLSNPAFVFLEVRTFNDLLSSGYRPKNNMYGIVVCVRGKTAIDFVNNCNVESLLPKK